MDGPLSPMRTLSIVLIALLAIAAIVEVREIVLIADEIGALERSMAGTSRPGELAAVITRREASGIGFLLLFLASGLVWLCWQHRGQRNLHRAHRPSLRFSPAWAVIWWFIPIASLWKPFQTVRELRSRSDPGERTYVTQGWWVIGLWWASVLAFWFIGPHGTPAMWDAAAAIGDLKLDIVGSLAGILAGGLAIWIVRDIWRRQEALPPWVPTRPDDAAAWRALPAPPG